MKAKYYRQGYLIWKVMPTYVWVRIHNSIYGWEPSTKTSAEFEDGQIKEIAPEEGEP
jgi:hypothetical protein